MTILVEYPILNMKIFPVPHMGMELFKYRPEIVGMQNIGRIAAFFLLFVFLFRSSGQGIESLVGPENASFHFSVKGDFDYTTVQQIQKRLQVMI